MRRALATLGTAHLVRRPAPQPGREPRRAESARSARRPLQGASHLRLVRPRRVPVSQGARRCRTTRCGTRVMCPSATGIPPRRCTRWIRPTNCASPGSNASAEFTAWKARKHARLHRSRAQAMTGPHRARRAPAGPVVPGRHISWHAYCSLPTAEYEFRPTHRVRRARQRAGAGAGAPGRRRACSRATRV